MSGKCAACDVAAATRWQRGITGTCFENALVCKCCHGALCQLPKPGGPCGVCSTSVAPTWWQRRLAGQGDCVVCKWCAACIDKHKLRAVGAIRLAGSEPDDVSRRRKSWELAHLKQGDRQLLTEVRASSSQVAAAIESQVPTEAVAMQLSSSDQEEQHHLAPFAGLEICISGYSSKKVQMGKFVKRFGGRHNPELNKATCNVLVSELPGGQKYKMAKKWGKDIVSDKWIEDSVAAGHCKDTASYAVKPSGVPDPPGSSMGLEPVKVVASQVQPTQESGPGEPQHVDAAAGEVKEEGKTKPKQERARGAQAKERMAPMSQSEAESGEQCDGNALQSASRKRSNEWVAGRDNGFRPSKVKREHDASTSMHEMPKDTDRSIAAKAAP
ncbi:TPA: hypothetical protein ACH3X1_012806 [Trebouxia sp. C0004]